MIYIFSVKKRNRVNNKTRLNQFITSQIFSIHFRFSLKIHFVPCKSQNPPWAKLERTRFFYIMHNHHHHHHHVVVIGELIIFFEFLLSVLIRFHYEVQARRRFRGRCFWKKFHKRERWGIILGELLLLRG